MPGGPALVTGGGGFAGRWLVALLRERGVEVVAPSRAELDLLDGDAVARALATARPGAIFHLAALASVGRSWQAPREPLEQNLAMTVNVLEAARKEAPAARVLVTSSGEVYGPPEQLPVTEDGLLRPQNPYAVSKAACDLLAGQYADAHGLSVVRTRAFNHAGPGQSDQYLIGTLTRQMAEAELSGLETLDLHVGNADSARDFTDVRDVVRAYTAAINLEPGAYNVCSGRARSVSEVIGLLVTVADGDEPSVISTIEDPDRIRAHDVPEIRGSAGRLHQLTGWTPEIHLGQTIRDAYVAWREQLKE